MPRMALGWLRDDLIARPFQDAPVRHVKAATPAGGISFPSDDRDARFARRVRRRAS